MFKLMMEARILLLKEFLQDWQLLYFKKPGLEVITFQDIWGKKPALESRNKCGLIEAVLKKLFYLFSRHQVDYRLNRGKIKSVYGRTLTISHDHSVKIDFNEAN